MKTMTHSVKRSIISVLCLSIWLLQPYTLLTSKTYAQGNDPARERAIRAAKAKSQEQTLRSQAGQYDQAIRSIGTIVNMPLKTAADIQKALAVLARSTPSLKLIDTKINVIALDTPGFRAGIEANVDQVKPSPMLRQIRQSPAIISRSRGFNDLRNAIHNQFASDANVLQRVAQKLDAASRHQAVALPSDKADQVATTLAYSHAFAAEKKNFSVVKAGYHPNLEAAPEAFGTAAVEPFFQTGLEVIVITAVGVIITAYAARKSLDFTEPEHPGNSQDTRSRFRVCMDNAEAERDSCLRSHRNDFFAQAGCWAKFAVEQSRCLVLPL